MFTAEENFTSQICTPGKYTGANSKDPGTGGNYHPMNLAILGDADLKVFDPNLLASTGRPSKLFTPKNNIANLVVQPKHL